MKYRRIKSIFLCLSLVFTSVLMAASDVDALRYGQDVNLSTVDASYIGTLGGDYFGSDVGILGDINGDGFDDYAISCYNQIQSNGKNGDVWIFFGKSEGWTKNAAPSVANASLIRGNWDDSEHTMVSGVGDVNGDGLSDFIVGIMRNNEVALGAGKVYLFLGRATGWHLEIPLEGANASFRGEHEGDFAGSFVSGAGDVNGDGLDDFLIGAPGVDEVSGAAGKCYLIFGMKEGWARNVSLTGANASFRGERNLSSLFQVAGVGDVNGDGFDDFMLGATTDSEIASVAGQAYLFLGHRSGWQVNTSAASADASFLGESAGDQASTGIGGNVDVNGDGLDDLLIGSYLHDSESGTDSGQVYIVFGRRTGWSMDTALSNANATLRGSSADEQAGYRIEGVGDVNGDGLGDFLVGARMYTNSFQNQGKAYLVLGSRTGWKQDMKLADAACSFVGESGASMAGNALAGNGDVDGDGFDDIMIGSFGYTSPTYAFMGKAYLIFPDHNAPLISISSI